MKSHFAKTSIQIKNYDFLKMQRRAEHDLNLKITNKPLISCTLWNLMNKAGKNAKFPWNMVKNVVKNVNFCTSFQKFKQK